MRQERIARQVADFDTLVDASIFQAAASERRAALVPQLRDAWSALETALRSALFTKADAELSRAIDRQRRAQAHQLDGSGLRAALAVTAELGASSDTIGAHGGSRDEDGSAGAAADQPVDLVAVARQWRRAMQRLVGLMGTAGSASGSGSGGAHQAGGVFQRVSSWLPQLNEHVELSSKRLAQARALNTSLEEAIRQVRASVTNLQHHMRAVPGASATQAQPRKPSSVATPGGQRGLVRTLVQATPANLYGPRSLDQWGRSTARASSHTGASRVPLATVVRPSTGARLPRSTVKATASRAPQVSPVPEQPGRVPAAKHMHSPRSKSIADQCRARIVADDSVVARVLSFDDAGAVEASPVVHPAKAAVDTARGTGAGAAPAAPVPRYVPVPATPPAPPTAAVATPTRDDLGAKRTSVLRDIREVFECV